MFIKQCSAFVLGVAVVTAAAAQQRPSDDEINAMIQALAAQRNAAHDQVARLAGQLATLEKALREAQESAKACKPEGKKEVPGQ